MIIAGAEFTGTDIVAIATGISGVFAVALKIIFDLVRARRVKNGHESPTHASVRPRDALWFAQTQASTLRVCNRIARHLGVDPEEEARLE